MKLPNLHGKAVYLQWRDSSSFRGTWRDLSEFKEVSKALLCQTLGFVVQQNDSCITVASHTTQAQASGDITIPVESIFFYAQVTQKVNGKIITL